MVPLRQLLPPRARLHIRRPALAAALLSGLVLALVWKGRLGVAGHTAARAGPAQAVPGSHDAELSAAAQRAVRAAAAAIHKADLAANHTSAAVVCLARGVAAATGEAKLQADHAIALAAALLTPVAAQVADVAHGVQCAVVAGGASGAAAAAQRAEAVRRQLATGAPASARRLAGAALEAASAGLRAHAAAIDALGSRVYAARVALAAAASGGDGRPPPGVLDADRVRRHLVDAGGAAKVGAVRAARSASRALRQLGHSLGLVVRPPQAQKELAAIRGQAIVLAQRTKAGAHVTVHVAGAHAQQLAAALAGAISGTTGLVVGTTLTPAEVGMISAALDAVVASGRAVRNRSIALASEVRLHEEAPH